MGTYRSKEIFEARQFTGEITSAKDLANWVKDKYDNDYLGSTLHESEERGSFLDVRGPTTVLNDLSIVCNHKEFILSPNDWLVFRNETGTFTTMSAYAFKRLYEEAETNEA